jgi:hypothetical protein
MKAKLYVTRLCYGLHWGWELKPLSGMRATIEGDNVYRYERSARLAANRWAKKHNIEIVEDGEA